MLPALTPAEHMRPPGTSLLWLNAWLTGTLRVRPGLNSTFEGDKQRGWLPVAATWPRRGSRPSLSVRLASWGRRRRVTHSAFACLMPRVFKPSLKLEQGVRA